MKFLVLLAFLPFMLSAQQKGATPIQSEKQSGERGKTYAVVVGISDYQDQGIPDLRFADKDAEAFANFLRSPAGGSLDGDHLKLLLNGEATMAQFAIGLDWLVENTKEGDNAIVYFSGHGDVEKKTLTQPGFLLCWDAPARVYMSGGAFGLSYLQEVISTLSIQNKAKVVVITDACRSGTLAGQSIGGAQATAANLAKQYANEIKILSCQPNEYSIEGEQWGGGRGAFSFNLVDALYGLADGNKDLSVTLQEVGRYLEDHVTAEVAPVSQVPMVLGNRGERLANVDAKLLADLRSGRTSQMKMLSPVETRGMEDDVLAGVDTTVRELYDLFKKSLKDKVFLLAPLGEPAIACAEAYYERLITQPKLTRLHSTMTRNYAAALQDDAQQVLNTMLKTGLTEDVLLNTEATKLYGQYPDYLGRAAQLLGEGHYMYAALQARKYFFEGQVASTRTEKQIAYRQALKWQPDMPHAMAEMVNTYKATQTDSAYFYFSKAASQVPAWVVPYLRLARFYQYKTKEPSKAEEILKGAGLIDSTSVLVWYNKGQFYKEQKNLKAAEYWFKKAIEGAGTEICFPCAWNNLGSVYYNTRRLAEAEAAYKKSILLDSTFVNAWNSLGSVYANARRYVEAEAAYKKAIMLDSTFVSAWNNLGNVYYNTRRYAEAEATVKKAILLDSTYVFAWSNLGNVYINSRHYAEAEAVFKKVILLDSTLYLAWYNLACLNSLQNKLEVAFAALEQALKKGYNNYNEMQQDADLVPLRVQKERWNTSLRNGLVPDSTDSKAWLNLASYYFQNQLYGDAEPILKKALILDSTLATAHYQLGKVYFKKSRPADARQEFLKAIELSPKARMARLGMAWLLLPEGKTTEALNWVEQAIEKGAAPFDVLQSDEDLAPLHTLPEWKALMKKYFPEQN